MFDRLKVRISYVNHVAKEVAKLTVRDDGNRSTDRQAKVGDTSSPATSVASKPASPPTTSVQDLQPKAIIKDATNPCGHGEENTVNTEANRNTAALNRWKMQPREGDEAQSKLLSSSAGKEGNTEEAKGDAYCLGIAKRKL